MERLVVVGNGMVGHRFCERLGELGGAGRFRLTVLGEEPRCAYDRVHLTSWFSGRRADALALADRDWYRARGIELRLGERAEALDRDAGALRTSGGGWLPFDRLVLATGSAPFVPPLPGAELPGVFVYRTIEDLEAIAAWAVTARRAAVIGGGLLGLEAARALLDLGLETHVVEFAERLMARQLDAAGAALLQRAIQALGVRVHVGARSEAIDGAGRVAALRLAGRAALPVELVVVAAGI
ncbi:MAG TPA: FAD-dependent oxidoreductase, partial [Myxococcota bacterium]|nr:FAD-dependent oxidoreductase [Myxococcota bacterium]